MRQIVGLTLALMLWGTAAAEAASLRGSRAAMVEQNQVAKEHGLAFYQTPEDIRRAVARGELVELTGDENYEVADFVRFPYLQPEVRLFIERLAAQYREACGQKLVMTSAVRPVSGQPSNAHQLSVHPAGMAVDLRVSDQAACRNWLESAILNLERRGVLNGIREFHPPHYHIAVFPGPYMEYVAERLAAEEAAAEIARVAAEAEVTTESASPEPPVAVNLLVAAVETEKAGSQAGMPLPATFALLILALPFGLGMILRRARQR